MILQRLLPTRTFGCETPYMRRTTLLRVPLLGWRLYLHQFLRGDEYVELHDHPWHFWSCVVSGEYVEVTDRGAALRPTWNLAYRPARHRHRVETSGCWTVCLCSEKVRSWGFWDSLGAWTHWRTYLTKKGCI